MCENITEQNLALAECVSVIWLCHTHISAVWTNFPSSQLKRQERYGLEDQNNCADVLPANLTTKIQNEHFRKSIASIQSQAILCLLKHQPSGVYMGSETLWNQTEALIMLYIKSEYRQYQKYTSTALGD